mmetsp:Transcript_39953/g.61124  ORF Transcript_39953/g.61124 Transcript_39953/m.61124 type:complete len:121 (-) Transcript_39953:448-810(-)
MKTTIIKFDNSNRSSFDNSKFEIQVGQQLEWLRSIEQTIHYQKQKEDKRSKSYSPARNFSLEESITVSFLVVQHKKEILDSIYDIREALRETLNEGFARMLNSCVFESFMHPLFPSHLAM